jgi:hypothetical protein
MTRSDVIDYLENMRALSKGFSGAVLALKTEIVDGLEAMSLTDEFGAIHLALQAGEGSDQYDLITIPKGVADKIIAAPKTCATCKSFNAGNHTCDGYGESETHSDKPDMTGEKVPVLAAGAADATDLWVMLKVSPEHSCAVWEQKEECQ